MTPSRRRERSGKLRARGDTNGESSRRGSLVIVGTGINLVGQTTLEAVEWMRRAEKLFYLVTNPASAMWLRRLNPSATTLEDCYAIGKPRLKSYREMVDRILSSVRAGLRVCVAFYGHPGLFVNPAHDAIRRARREGLHALMLPGISTEDCLFADLGIDPCESGWQTYEATDFLMSRRRFDPSSGLVLWQVGVLGEPSIRKEMSCRPERLEVLVTVLRRRYPARHRVVIYEAAQFPICGPNIQRIRLARLPRMAVSPMATLYVPPRPSRADDPKIVRWLDES